MMRYCCSRFVHEQNEKFYKECTPKCHPPCHQLYVDQKVTTGVFPSPIQRENLLSITRSLPGLAHVTEDQLDSFAVLDLYYDDANYRVKEHHERITVDSLISKIGGSMGIWAGMSLVTVVQLLVYILDGILQFFGIRYAGGKPSDGKSKTKDVGVQTVNDFAMIELHPVKRYQLKSGN